jgi:hypothetical protein
LLLRYRYVSHGAEMGKSTLFPPVTYQSIPEVSSFAAASCSQATTLASGLSKRRSITLSEVAQGAGYPHALPGPSYTSQTSEVYHQGICRNLTREAATA